MFELFGEMNSAEEINRTAQGLKGEGDFDNILKLAEENGVDEYFAQEFIQGTSSELCDVALAAVGKLEIEEKELNPVEIVADWTEYIKVSCLDDTELAVAVRRKGKTLKGCVAHLLKWSFKGRYKIEKDIIEAAGIKNVSVEMGIPGMGSAKKLIREYYLK